MGVLEQVLAAVVGLACLGAMAWTLLGQRRRQHWQGRFGALAQWRQRLRRSQAERLARQRVLRQQAQAEAEAQDLIERARRRATGPVRREGNVLRPERFERRHEGDVKGDIKGDIKGDGSAGDSDRRLH